MVTGIDSFKERYKAVKMTMTFQKNQAKTA